MRQIRTIKDKFLREKPSKDANRDAKRDAKTRSPRRPRKAVASKPPANKTAGKAPARDSKSSVQSLAKAFRLLEAIAATETDLTLSELAGAAALDPGTTHRMLNTLTDLGYVDRTEGKRFALTLKVLDLGFRAIGRRDIRTLARPLLRTLVDEVSEAASLGVLDGSDVLYVERIRAGMTRLGVDIRVGTLIPAANSVIGWAILAFLPPAEQARILALPSRQRDFRDVRQPADLETRLATVRRKGYALGGSLVSNDLTALAAPVLDRDGFPVAAVSVAAPGMRLTADELRDRALEPLRKTAQLIASGLEASGGAVG
ncbi:MAG: IclR family transcriptional regulator [Pseudolabrys sp.]